MKQNAMIEPIYTLPKELFKFDIKSSCLVFGCGVLAHENLFLNFINPADIVLYDPDPFKYVPSDLKVKGTTVPVIKSWSEVPKKKYDTIVCFFSLHFIPNWLDVLWDLHGMLNTAGELFIAEDKGFRSLLDFTYSLTDKDSLIDKSVVNAVWQKFLLRKENGFPWYPDISAGNMTQLREVLAPYYDFNASDGSRSYILERQYIPHEAEDYLPWNKDLWKFDISHYPDLNSLSTVKEKIVVYKLLKKGGDLPPLWDLTNDEFLNNIWSLKMLHCHRALIRNSPAFGIEDELMSVERLSSIHKFIRSYLAILYQHLLRHLPGGVAEFVSLHPKRFYEFATPQKRYFPGLPHVSWTIDTLGFSKEEPSWYTNYIKQLDESSGELMWAGEIFLVENTGALTYLLKNSDCPDSKMLDHYYSANIYNEEYCNAHGYVCKERPEDWDKRKVNPCIYITVQASKAKRENEGGNKTTGPYGYHHELRYVGFVLYLPSKDIDDTQKEKYILIGSLLSHLLSYVQAQITTFLAVTALDVLMPYMIREQYEGIDLGELAEIYNNIFMPNDDLHFSKQHNMTDITAVKTAQNISSMEPAKKETLTKYLTKIGLDKEKILKTDFGCKWLKAITGRHKNSMYLFDLYLSLQYQLNKDDENKFLDLFEKTKEYLEDYLPEIEFQKCLYAFWYASNCLNELLMLKDELGKEIGLKKIVFSKNALMLITNGGRFPEIFYQQTGRVHSGSFGNYVNKANVFHLKLFEYDHTFLYLTTPIAVEKFGEFELTEFVANVPPPPIYRKSSNFFQISHSYILFNETGLNVLLLRHNVPAQVTNRIIN